MDEIPQSETHLSPRVLAPRVPATGSRALDGAILEARFIFVILTLIGVGVYLAFTIPVAVFPNTDFPEDRRRHR
jgi:hypothetical protein